MIKKLTYPKVLLFDCFETIIENDILRWKQLFKKIISINNWDLDANDFWNLWKKYDLLDLTYSNSVNIKGFLLYPLSVINYPKMYLNNMIM